MHVLIVFPFIDKKRSSPSQSPELFRMFSGISKRTVLIAFIVVCACIIVYVYARQRKFYYRPRSPRVGPTPANIGLKHWNIVLNESIDAWWVPGYANMPTVFVCHGNAGNISHRLPLISVIRQTGMGAFLFDYPGYGNSIGEPCEESLHEATLIAWKWLKKRTGAQNIIVLGRSIGGGVACNLVFHLIQKAMYQSDQPLTKHLPKALILDSTFTSLPEACVCNIGWATNSFLVSKLIRFMARDQYNNQEKIPYIHKHVPVTIVHTVNDKVIPLKHALHNATISGCAFLQLPFGGHDDGYMRSASVFQKLLLQTAKTGARKKPLARSVHATV